MANYLSSRPLEARHEVWEGFLCNVAKRDEIVMALAGVDPAGPPPVAEPARSFVTVADIRRTQSETRWVWNPWIPSSTIVGIGAFEGTGKTRFALDLCRRIHLELPWPDGQGPTFPKGTRTAWMCADAQQDELAEVMPGLGLPDEAIVFPTLSDDPYGGTDLDDEKTLVALEECIRTIKPGLVLIDTLTSATSSDLCDQRSMKPLKAKLARLVQTYQTSIILQLHLSREGQALGRRIKGITRTLIHLECPDPDRSERLRLWVEKSYAKKPPPLGVTMGDAGNTYDFDPPRKPEPNQGGRPPESRDKARAFIIDALNRENDRKATALCLEWTNTGNAKNAFWSARDAMVAAGELVCEGKPLVLHLNRTEAVANGKADLDGRDRNIE